MTDNEIVKALECCKKDDCDHCPNDFGNCYSNLAKYALDLINRQKAEVERLIAKVNHFQYLHEIFTTTPTNRIKAEAYKEFAERLKADIPSSLVYIPLDMVENIIDNILKELVGDNNG